ncbi:ER membrane glycoprotein subunit of the GPI transamidase complex-like protein [Coemansia interrupta]|uniref:GPI mannosyltransferase 2 n=1 Tax=Coemansia interrupta TaxID=1126814 RepID=A0A9W8LJ24_9FUNG|nr:ER membrane glycoprotein subunit of the GPI transamidase complex-like protein [Coemansia interrupta]
MVSSSKGAVPICAYSRSRIHKVIQYAVLSRVVALLLGAVSNAIVSDYDSSLSVILPVPASDFNSSVISALCGWFARSLAQVVVRWDAFYFVHIADAGYVYEQEHAFFPLLPLLMRMLSSSVLLPFVGAVGRPLALIVAGVIVSNVSFVLAAATLYILGVETMRNDKLAYIAALMYVIAPSNIFMSAVCTESLFALLVFLAMLFIGRCRYLLAAGCIAISGLCRSNGLVYAGFFVWNLVVRADIWRGCTPSSGSRLAAALARRALGALSLVGLSAAGFVAFEIYGRNRLCNTHADFADVLSKRPYCTSTWSTIYGFVQAEYWNVGFLRYYTLQQLPNFLLAAPMIGLSLAGLWTYLAYDPVRFATLGWIHRGRSLGAKPDTVDAVAAAYFDASLLPHMYLWALLLGVATTTMHVQVITRFFSSVPAVFWFAAHVVAKVAAQKEELASAQASRSKRWVSWVVVGYFVGYGLVGVVLFSNFFPPA